MIDHIVRGIHIAVRVFAWIGACAGAFMVIVIVCNVLGRFLFKYPIQGTIELVELMSVVLIYSVLPYAEFRRRSIYVDVVVNQLPGHARAGLASLMLVIGTVFFITMGWKAGELTWSNLFPYLISTDTLSIPFAPFLLVIAIGTLLLGLEMLINAFHPLSHEEKPGGK